MKNKETKFTDELIDFLACNLDVVLALISGLMFMAVLFVKLF